LKRELNTVKKEISIRGRCICSLPKAKWKLETGHGNEAYRIADNLLKDEVQSPPIKIGALIVVATIKMRRGDADVLPLLLEAKSKALETMELQRIIPTLVALLEYEWINGNGYHRKRKTGKDASNDAADGQYV
jgi:hypothetical protein